MTFSTLTLTMFLAGFLGLAVPGAALFQYIDFRRRESRMPEATKFENLVAMISEKQDELISYEEKLKDLAEQEVRRNMAVAETEECLARKRQAEDDLLTLQPRLMELESVNQELSSKNESLANIAGELARSKAELEEMKLNIAVLPKQKSILENEIEDLRRTKSEIGKSLEQMETRLDRLKTEVTELEPYKNRLTEDILYNDNKLSQIRSQLEDEQLKLLELQGQIPQLENNKSQLQSSLDSLQKSHDEETFKLEILRESVDTTKEVLSNLKTDLHQQQQSYQLVVSETEKQEKELKKFSEQLDETRQKLNELKSEIAGLKTIKAVLDGEVSTAQSMQEQISEKSLEDLITAPACLDGRKKPAANITENKALENLYSHLETLNLSYSKRVLKSFHTNLKISHISPMVALAGISGTGKSELPKRYAEAMGLHFLQVAVQPRWDSPQDLFGFYNYLEQRYKATELARAMVRLDRWNWPNLAKEYKDKMLLVLLDEMNLARVEYYFSEFLSRLEGRKSVNPEDPVSRQPVEMELDLGKRKGETGTKRVFPSQNVLFVGTMNEDESTQSMSDKVIDRAPVIRFARPRRLVDEPPQTDSVNSDYFIPVKTWSGWRRDLTAISHDARDHVDRWINRLNKSLDAFGRPFGHRLNQAILAYVANHPDMINDQSVHNARRAFADQLEQRIFPKLRGLEMEEQNNESSYKEILELVKEDLQDEELAYAFEESKKKILFTWLGVRREEEK